MILNNLLLLKFLCCYRYTYKIWQCKRELRIYAWHGYRWNSAASLYNSINSMFNYV